MNTATETAERIIRQQKGIIRTSDALKAGIHPRTLYALRDQGILEQFSRGVYRLAATPTKGNPDLLSIAIRAPKSVLCLISALSFHEITTQVPHEVNIAVKKGSRSPCLDHPPIVVYHFSQPSFEAGIEEHQVDGVTVRVYSPEKTIADCFKFRNVVGMDVVLETLKLYKQRGSFKVEKLLKYAAICRVKKVMQPYLEAII